VRSGRRGSGSRRVLARSVVPSIRLLQLHAAVHEQLGLTDDGWTPHVTLAKRLQVASLAEALELLGPSITGAATGIRSYDPDTRAVSTLA
jgi:hypothetical protein